MSDIDLIDKDDYEEVESVDEGLDDIEEKGKRRTTKHQLKIRRAIEEHLDNKRFRQEIDYLNEDFDE